MKKILADYLDIVDQIICDTNSQPISASNLLDLIPASIYWKNSKSVYLGRNQYAAEKNFRQKFEKNLNKSYVFGKTDHDFFSKKIANNFVATDIELFSKNLESIDFTESFLLPSGESVFEVSTKKLFTNRKGEMFVIGCTLDMTGVARTSQLRQSILDNFTYKLQNFFISLKLELLTELIKDLYALAIYHKDSQEFRKVLLFTERELACLCFLIRGFSAKQTAQYLQISYRTVEVFIEQIKKKLKMSCKSQLIDWFWNLLSELQ